MSTEVVFLGLVTLYSLSLPLRSTLTMVDGAVLLAIFGGYLYRLSQASPEEPDLAGTSRYIGELDRRPRRLAVAGVFAVAALIILATAEHFANGLVSTGGQLGVDPFILVQWVAPLASEAPELIVACLYAARLKGGDALGALLSSKVNQWSLLVGTIPVVFAVFARTTDGLPLDGHQRLELLLTASQSLFAVSILVDLGVTIRAAAALFALFGIQFAASVAVPPELNRTVTIVLSAVYLLLAVGLLVHRRSDAARLARDGIRTPVPELEAAGR
jgi:cation:H+ antiporter